MLEPEELYLDSVSHRYGKRQILSSVFINCRVGETVGLLGRNGSGKSTLLKIIFGSLSPLFMCARINGYPYHKGFLTKNIAYLPQEYFIPDHLTVGKAVNLLIQRHKESLLTVDFIKDNYNKPMDQLSGGLRRLIECLLIMYNNAQFILLDEPFS